MMMMKGRRRTTGEAMGAVRAGGRAAASRLSQPPERSRRRDRNSTKTNGERETMARPEAEVVVTEAVAARAVAVAAADTTTARVGAVLVVGTTH
jgi:hypothetical protein